VYQLHLLQQTQQEGKDKRKPFGIKQRLPQPSSSANKVQEKKNTSMDKLHHQQNWATHWKIQIRPDAFK
jgi:hypothetical protein